MRNSSRYSLQPRRARSGVFTNTARVAQIITRKNSARSWVRYAHSAAIRARLADAHAPSTANKMLAALRGVLEEAWRLGTWMLPRCGGQPISLPCVVRRCLPGGT